jgi:hypothetical protein
MTDPYAYPLDTLEPIEPDTHLLETFHPIESDPLGLAQHTPGAKLDQGKTRAGLVLLAFARALDAVAQVGTFGANKYTDNGWLSVPNGESRYTDALLRHLLAEGQGEALDPESGLPHASHAAWNALARLDLYLRRVDEPAQSQARQAPPDLPTMGISDEDDDRPLWLRPE